MKTCNGLDMHFELHLTRNSYMYLIFAIPYTYIFDVHETLHSYRYARFTYMSTIKC